MECKFNWNEKYKTKSKYHYLDHFSVIPAENGHVDETFDQPKYEIALLLYPRLETNEKSKCISNGTTGPNRYLEDH